MGLLHRLFVTAAQIGDGQVIFNECSGLNSSKAKKLRKGWARTGGVLLTHRAMVCRVAIVDDVVDPFWPRLMRNLVGHSG